MPMRETSLAVQWLRLLASRTEDLGSIPGQGTRVPQVVRPTKKKKKRLPLRDERYIGLRIHHTLGKPVLKILKVDQ